MDECDLLAQMKLLHDSYAEKLPGKLAEIERMWEAMANVAWGGAAFEELLRALHSLAGSGKTFGFPGVSEAARAAELALAGFGAANTAPGAEQRSRIQGLILGLRDSVNRV